MADEVLRTVTASRSLRAGALARVEHFAEGRAAQVLHVGAYADEAATIARLHGFISDHGGRLVGRHHEIYLSDPRRTAPDRLRTIIRQPFDDD
jgi:hypothetical protein